MREQMVRIWCLSVNFQHTEKVIKGREMFGQTIQLTMEYNERDPIYWEVVATRDELMAEKGYDWLESTQLAMHNFYWTGCLKNNETFGQTIQLTMEYNERDISDNEQIVEDAHDQSEDEGDGEPEEEEDEELQEEEDEEPEGEEDEEKIHG